jgi:hypothetical protein
MLIFSRLKMELIAKNEPKRRHVALAPLVDDGSEYDHRSRLSNPDSI